MCIAMNWVISVITLFRNTDLSLTLLEQFFMVSVKIVRMMDHTIRATAAIIMNIMNVMDTATLKRVGEKIRKFV